MDIRHVFLATLLAASTAVCAQPTPPVQATTEPGGSGTQRIEHLHIEDAGSRIDEQRYGGETRSIDVQSKTRVPAYQVQPHAPYSREAGPGRTGPRTWKILDF